MAMGDAGVTAIFMVGVGCGRWRRRWRELYVLFLCRDMYCWDFLTRRENRLIHKAVFNRQVLSNVTTTRGTNRNYLSYLETTLLPGEESEEATCNNLVVQ